MTTTATHIFPSGHRRLTPAMLATESAATHFAGVADDKTTPGAILAAFKAAAPQLGLSPRVVQAIDWFFRFTQPQDWQAGQRPIVWPAARMQEDALGLSPTRAKALNRHLAELGLIVMRDSPNGKRYGRRARNGAIIEAYGFDLSPLAIRLDEFRARARAWTEEREAMKLLRRRATIARKALEQLAETAAELDLPDPSWALDAAEARRLTACLAKTARLPRLQDGVAALEARLADARQRLEAVLAALRTASMSVDKDPMGSENGSHLYNYKPPEDPEQDTVTGIEESKSWPAPGRRAQAPGQRQGRTDSGTVLRITPDELIQLAPKLRPYITRSSPTWPDLVEAADWLRHDLGVSKPLWGDACLIMGREQAAIALALVSTKPREHFKASPGGYFNGMVAKARAGTLNLGRSLWGLRAANALPATTPRARPH